MSNLFYEQLEKGCEENDYDTLRKLIYKEKRRVKELFEDSFNEHLQYEFYYGMYVAYQNVLSMLINLKLKEENNGNNIL